MPTRTLVLTDHDLEAYLAQHRMGLRAASRPYGMGRLEELGHVLGNVSLVEGGRLATAVEHRLGAPVVRPWKAARAARRSDLVLAVLDHWAVVPGWLRRVPGSGYRHRPLVSVLCWAAERLTSGDEAQRRNARAVLRNSDLIGFWSGNQARILTDHGADPDRLVSLTFGTETDYFGGDPAAPRDIDILAAGVDHGRDYTTLAEAVTGTDLQVALLAKDANLAGVDLPANVTVTGTVPLPDYAAMLRRARVVVVPTKPLAYPTGQTVALDAAASGAAVVVTGTEPMREYFTDGVTALMPAAGDALALSRALARLTSDEAMRQRIAAEGHSHVMRRHDASRMWDELDEALRERRWAGTRET